MNKLIVKQENGRFYLQSGQNWITLPERCKTLADVKKFYNTENIELVTQSGNPYMTIDILDYDNIHLSFKDESGEQKIYFPDATEKQITDFLLSQGRDQGYSQVIIKFRKPFKEPASTNE